ncbi:MAG: hypothetical protein QM802_21865 [Agriterribacter sp.]
MSENQIFNQSADEAGSNADVQEAATATTATTNELVQAVAEPVTAHDDFDWSIDKRNVSSYSKDEKDKYDAVYEGTFKSISDNEMVEGTVVALTKTDVVINIGFKSDGLVSQNEFRDLQALKVGDIVEVMVVEKEDREEPPALKP